MSKKIISVQLDLDTYNQLTNQAVITHEGSVSRLVRQIIKAYLDKKSAKKS